MTTEIQKPQTNALLEKVEKDCRRARKELKEVLLIRQQVREIIPLMPEAILNQQWYVFRQTEANKWYMETWCLEEEEADTFIKQLKLAGVYGFHSKFKDSNRWHYTGSFAIDGHEFTVKVDGGSQPPHCRIVETREMKEVVTYKAICEETEEEVK